MESENNPENTKETLGEQEPPVEQEPMAQPVELPEVKKSTLRRIKNAFTPKSIALTMFVLASLVVIMYLAIYVRSSTLPSPTVLDYDPWFWYRRAEMILNNNMQIPEWDELSHYPPGRPVFWGPGGLGRSEIFQGWAYAIAIIFKILNPLIGFTLTDAAKWSTPIFAAAMVIPAYYLGKRLSNKFGGLATALFGVLSPALIGVSMAGYCDTDMAVVFFTFLTVYAVLLAIRRKFSMKSLPYYIIAVIVNLLFLFTWGYGWIILIFFTGFMFAIFIFRAIEQIIHNRNFKIDVNELKKEIQIVKSLFIIIIPTNIFAYLLGYASTVPFFPMLELVGMGLIFLLGTGNIVNISVAELQTLSIFTKSGFEAIVGRVGLGPVLFTLMLPLLALYKIYKKEKITFMEVFMYIWVGITFVLITFGVRFSLLFSTATSVAAGYAIGNIPKYLKNKFVRASFYGFTFLIMLIFVSTGITAGLQGRGMQISGNWYEMLDWIKDNTDQRSLIVTWWDPGHIIAGYTGRPVHADGAHCGAGTPIMPGCIPYSHDDRIQDMGRTFAISDEEESISILEKYRQLNPEQCAEIREKFGDALPADVCDQIPEMYVIASNDLIGKYYWLSYFGTGTGRNYFQMQISNPTTYQTDGALQYNGGQLSLVFQGNELIPVLNSPEQGIRNAVISHIVYFENGQERRLDFSDQANVVDGMVWVDPNYGVAIFMDASIRDSMFTKMFFFNGDGLEHFELVYSNPEIRLFKVIW
jgi:dolichyl-diphosphooligosaccharide--protein glycosyltransferase